MSSLRIDTTDLIAGSLVIGVTGLGIPGSLIPTTGEHGGSLLANDIDSGDENKEFRALIGTPNIPEGASLFVWEDGSVEITNAADGSYIIPYTLYVDGVNLGAASATLTVGEASIDTQAPTWATGAAINQSNLTQTSYTLTWPAASDNIAVTGYELSLDGGSTYPISVGGSTLTYNVAGRTAGTTDQVRVRAFDAINNKSSVLSLAVQLQSATPTADTQAPTWANGASIGSSNITQTTYTLTWPAASDNVAVTGYEISLDGGASYPLSVGGSTLTYNVTGRTAGTTDQVRVRATDAANNKSSSLSTTVQLLAAVDSTAPTWPNGAAITKSNITQTTYTLTWPAASDNVAVASYEVSVDSGVNWVSKGTALTTNITGRVAGTTDSVMVRVKDAANNISSSLSTSVTLLSVSTGDGDLTARVTDLETLVADIQNQLNIIYSSNLIKWDGSAFVIFKRTT